MFVKWGTCPLHAPLIRYIRSRASVFWVRGYLPRIIKTFSLQNFVLNDYDISTLWFKWMDCLPGPEGDETWALEKFDRRKFLNENTLSPPMLGIFCEQVFRMNHLFNDSLIHFFFRHGLLYFGKFSHKYNIPKMQPFPNLNSTNIRSTSNRLTSFARDVERELKFHAHPTGIRQPMEGGPKNEGF